MKDVISRVLITKQKVLGRVVKGEMGNVIGGDADGFFAVRMDRKGAYFHNCKGKCEYGYGLWLEAGDFEWLRKERA